MVTKSILLGCMWLILLSTPPHNLPAQVPSTDSLALVEFYQSANGSSWLNNTNWLTGPVDSWYGVTVSYNRITELVLGNNQVSGSIPAMFGNLTALKHLNLANNNFEGSIPAYFGNLGSLVSLNLSGNNFTGTPPPELYNLRKLCHLTLGRNNLDGLVPPWIGDFPELTHLELSYNAFEGEIPKKLGDLEELIWMDLCNNELSGPIPTDLGDLSNLQYLILSENQLSGIVPSEIGALSKLHHLDLKNNELEQLADISSLTITTVYVQGNYFQFDDIELNSPIINFYYSPQKKVQGGFEQNILVGKAMDLEFTVGGTLNQYQWSKNGILISGEDTDRLSFTSCGLNDSGTYELTITNPNCPGLVLKTEPIILHVLETITGVEDHELNLDLNIFPNPSSGSVEVQFFSNGGKNELYLLGINGSNISTLVDDFLPYGKHKVVVNTSFLNAGIYVVYHINDGQRHTKKMIVSDVIYQ